MMNTVYIVKVEQEFGPDDTYIADYDGVMYHNKRLALEIARLAAEEPGALSAWVEEMEVTV